LKKCFNFVGDDSSFPSPVPQQEKETLFGLFLNPRTLRVGPVGSDGLVIREECIKALQ